MSITTKRIHKNNPNNMKALTEHQKNFLLLNFFRNEKYAGWKNIATTLLETGECIVAGTECIWVGGIGNFIKTQPAKGTVGCTLYKFDLDYFFTSEWYKAIKNDYTDEIANKKREIEQEYKEMCNL